MDTKLSAASLGVCVAIELWIMVRLTLQLH